jgi:hypothetical protein
MGFSIGPMGNPCQRDFSTPFSVDFSTTRAPTKLQDLSIDTNFEQFCENWTDPIEKRCKTLTFWYFCTSKVCKILKLISSEMQSWWKHCTIEKYFLDFFVYAEVRNLEILNSDKNFWKSIVTMSIEHCDEKKQGDVNTNFKKVIFERFIVRVELRHFQILMFILWKKNYVEYSNRFSEK